jgi:hypothetical protein
VAQFRIQYLGIFVAAGLSISQPAAADSVAIAPLKDNTLYESPTGALSNGRGQHFFSGANGGGQRRRGVIAFDIAANIPAGSRIDSASLTLHMSRTMAGPVMISLHRCGAHWGEGDSIASGNEGQGAPAAPNDATWLHTFYDTTFWSHPGGDVGSAPSAGVLVDGVNFYTWPATTQVISDVQSWLDSPQTNSGWILIADGESQPFTTKAFDTRENVVPGFRPVLHVQFAPSTDAGLNDGGLEDAGSNDGGSNLPDGGQSLVPVSQSGCGYPSAPSGLSLLLGVLTVLLLATVRRVRRSLKRLR